ncbi:hypothetical protein HYW21_00625 [Candidatus Woesearchaeota archaeon]|nr:hypothetical protein [Candidatus Woesearchaeota archaeon]
MLDYPIRHQLILPANHNQCCYFEETEEQEFMEHIIQKFSGDEKKFRLFVHELYKLGEEYVAYAQRLGQQNLEEMSLKGLAQCYREYQQRALDYCCVLWLGYLLNEYWTNYGNTLLGNVDNSVRTALFKPQQKSTVVIMQEQAQRIAQIMSENEKHAAVERFWKTYQWLPCLDLHNTPWTLTQVEAYIKEVKPSSNTLSELSLDDAVQRANLNTKEQGIFKMIAELAYLKDKRDDFRRQGIFSIQPFFTALGKRMGLSLQEIAYLTEKEILAACEDAVSTTLPEKTLSALIAQRKQGFLMYLQNNETNTTICVTEHIPKTLAQLGFKEDAIDQTIIKGMGATKGKAKGKVAIVRTVGDLRHVTPGSILVAVTTHPDYVPAMQKAAAIVTDEGGLLSHAAIVSRELGLPCIVGTGNATKVLKNGNFVVVDADTGVVCIL